MKSTVCTLMAALFLLSVVAGCATTPPGPGSPVRSEPTIRSAHPCDVVDSGKPLPEIIAEMTYYERPIYPRLAEQAGLGGKVEIRALVGTDGIVRDAVVARTSGTVALDESARVAAYKCRFNPARRGGQPICMWVNYIVEFMLKQD